MRHQVRPHRRRAVRQPAKRAARLLSALGGVCDAQDGQGRQDGGQEGQGDVSGRGRVLSGGCGATGGGGVGCG
eukprot:7384066-Prymnesium_polylepis.1